MPGLARRRKTRAQRDTAGSPGRAISRRAWRPAAAAPRACPAAAAPPTQPCQPGASARPARCAAVCALPARPPAARAGAGAAAGTESPADRLRGEGSRGGAARSRSTEGMRWEEQLGRWGRDTSTIRQIEHVLQKLGVCRAAARPPHHMAGDNLRPPHSQGRTCHAAHRRPRLRHAKKVAVCRGGVTSQEAVAEQQRHMGVGHSLGSR